MPPTPGSLLKQSGKLDELGWKAQHVLLSGVSGISAVMRPAGLEASTDAVTAFWLKSPEDPIWDADDGMKEYRAFLTDWAPNEEVEDAVFPYSTAQIIVEILKNCGDDLSRENLISRQPIFEIFNCLCFCLA